MTPSRPSSFTSGQTPAWAMQSLLSTAVGSAKEALLRGYLHEVNNALAGVGTLAEALKGADYSADELDPQLDLIAQTTQKITLLEKRVRALLNIPQQAIVLETFLADNRELFELMLPRNQKLTFELTDEASAIEMQAPLLWQILGVSFYWSRTMQSAGITLRLVKQQTSAALSIELQGPIATDEEVLEEATKLEDALAYLANQNKIGFVNSHGALLFALGKYVNASVQG